MIQQGLDSQMGNLGLIPMIGAIVSPMASNYIMIGVEPDGITVINTSIGELHNNAQEYLSTSGATVGLGGFYDPSNGTVSPGDIVYHGPGLGFEPTVRKDFHQ
jgi:hypothetical protein